MNFIDSQGLVTFAFCLLSMTGLTVWSAYIFGPNKALAISSLASLMFPFWICIKPNGIEVHLILATAVAGLGVYLVHPKSVFKTRLIPQDYFMIALVLINAISDVTSTGLKSYIFLQIYGEWFVAYVVGRLSLAHFSNVRDLEAIGVVVTVGLATLSIMECITFVNMFLFLEFQGTHVESKLVRWGLRRACGPSEHPLYFGTLLLLLSPWVIQYSVKKFESTKSKYWFALILITFFGICGTLSRAPVIATAFLILVPSLVFNLKSRRPIVLFIGIFLILISLLPFQVLEIVERMGGERKSSVQGKMIVDGKEVVSGSAKTRVYLLQYYKSAVIRAGLFGYGSEATSTFPPRVPSGGNVDLNAMRNLKWIDNQYLLFTLRFGYLGVLCWTGALLCTAWNFFYLTGKCPIDLKWFCASNASVIVGVMFIQWTVWMPQDYGFYLIWLMGGSAGLVAEYQAKRARRSPVSRET